jgi:tetratricopeptide (TPR) repeat protein
MSVTVLISTVSDEFRPYRDLLRADLERHNVHVKVQEDFKNLGGDALDKLDVYIAHCDAVVHLVGDMTGSPADAREQSALLAKYPDLAMQLPPLGEALKDGAAISYTQWEAWLALYHGKLLLIAKAADAAERGPAYARPGDKGAAQIRHLSRLEAVKRYPGCTFASPADLAKHIAYTAILDLLVKDYAEQAARERDVALGFIHEMAKKVAGDRNLDFEGKKQAVRNAIEIYEKEIAGGLTQTNFGEIVDAALAKAKAQVDKGQSGLARATLRKAAEEMQREEKERRSAYVEGVTELYNRARDIALASYDGDAAAEAVVALVEAVHGADRAGVYKALTTETKALRLHGRDRGSNVHLVASISLTRKLLDAASSIDERGTTRNDLGVALRTLGERESGTTRLEEAVATLRATVAERTRERVPLAWAATQSNLGNALGTFGEREIWLGRREVGTARLEEAVAAYRAALEELTRERVPLYWATAQNNLGNALRTLGERESGTARLDEAVRAYREALKERTRERAPLDWAQTQNNLGIALTRLGMGESGTARLHEAVAAFREALKEWTRERVPFYWAGTQNNLGAVLDILGERECGTTRLDEAVAAYRAALEEWTPEAAPYQHGGAQQNLDKCLALLEQRRKS